MRGESSRFGNEACHGGCKLREIKLTYLNISRSEQGSPCPGGKTKQIRGGNKQEGRIV